MPAIEQLTRIEPVHLARLQAHGLFTTGLLLERTETPTRRQTLADQTDASPADVAEWQIKPSFTQPLQQIRQRLQQLPL